MIRQLNISGYNIPNNLFLAPMAGITNKAFRIMAKKFGAGLTFTEMVSLEGLYRFNKKTYNYINIENEEFVIIQIFGKNEPEKFYKVSKELQKLYSIQMIDVNFGCPVKKVTKIGAGSSLLNDLQAISDIVKALKDSGVRVSTKIRLGYDKNIIENLIQILDKSEVDLITIHGRLATQLYSGKADWESIKKIREMTNKIIIANGDINSPEKAEQVLNLTKADGIMIGRAALSCGYIFKQIIDYFKYKNYQELNFELLKNILLEYAYLYSEIYKTNSIIPIKSILINSIKNFAHAKELRNKISLLKTLNEFEILIINY